MARDEREGATRVLTLPAAPDPDVGEEAFLRLVLDLARALGWLAYHTRDARRSAAGFPDLVAVRGDVLLLAELKRADGRLRPEQRAWLDALWLASAENPTVYCFLWRPRDWPEIVLMLTCGHI